MIGLAADLRSIAKAISSTHADDANALSSIADELERHAHNLADASFACDSFFVGDVNERPHLLGALQGVASAAAHILIGRAADRKAAA
jgi:hypothetical protein